MKNYLNVSLRFEIVLHPNSIINFNFSVAFCLPAFVYNAYVLLRIVAYTGRLPFSAFPEDYSEIPSYKKFVAFLRLQGSWVRYWCKKNAIKKDEEAIT